jgi:hypothetical protein
MQDREVASAEESLAGNVWQRLSRENLEPSAKASVKCGWGPRHCPHVEGKGLGRDGTWVMHHIASEASQMKILSVARCHKWLSTKPSLLRKYKAGGTGYQTRRLKI